MRSTFFIGFPAPSFVAEQAAHIDQIVARRGGTVARSAPLHATVTAPRVAEQTAMIMVQKFVDDMASALDPVSVFTRQPTVFHHMDESYLVLQLEGTGVYEFPELRRKFGERFGENPSQSDVLTPHFTLLSTQHVARGLFEAVCEEVRHSRLASPTRLILSSLALYERTRDDEPYHASFEPTLDDTPQAA